MNKQLHRPALLACYLCLITPIAGAAPLTWLGSDHGLDGAASSPGKAFAAFTGALDGLGVQDSDDGETDFDLAFDSRIGARVSATELEPDSIAGAGRITTSGNTFLGTEWAGGIILRFDGEINAFGFYGTDVGDVGSTIFLTLLGGMLEVTLDIVSLLDVTNGIDNGGLPLFGFHNPDQTYTLIEFSFIDGPIDQFGIDDAMAGLVAGPRDSEDNDDAGDAVESSNVGDETFWTPIPAAGALILGGLAALFAILRFERRG